MREADRQWVESMAEAYQRNLVPTVFAPFAVDLAQRAAQLAPARVLELAAGTGVLTAALRAALPSADITATDLNDSMVRLGEQRAPEAAWRTADAMDLPFGSAEFDLVLCQFGVMFFPDKPAAFAEMGRVLAAGGACLFNAWGPLDAHDFEAAVTAACDRLFPDHPPRFLRSVPHFYADVDDLVADVEAGGLSDIAVEEVVREGTARSAADVAAGYCFGTPLRAEIETRGGDFEAAAEAIAAEIERRLGPAPLTGRMQAHVVTARSPG